MVTTDLEGMMGGEEEQRLSEIVKSQYRRKNKEGREGK